jgi:hypothetical protein
MSAFFISGFISGPISQRRLWSVANAGRMLA